MSHITRYCLDAWPALAAVGRLAGTGNDVTLTEQSDWGTTDDWATHQAYKHDPLHSQPSILINI